MGHCNGGTGQCHPRSLSLALTLCSIRLEQIIEGQVEGPPPPTHTRLYYTHLEHYFYFPIKIFVYTYIIIPTCTLLHILLYYFTVSVITVSSFCLVWLHSSLPFSCSDCGPGAYSKSLQIPGKPYTVHTSVYATGFLCVHPVWLWHHFNLHADQGLNSTRTFYTFPWCWFWDVSRGGLHAPGFHIQPVSALADRG